MACALPQITVNCYRTDAAPRTLCIRHPNSPHRPNQSFDDAAAVSHADDVAYVVKGQDVEDLWSYPHALSVVIGRLSVTELLGD
ncbi:MAG: hypothetical protein H8D43_02895 [Chloroflexi bacterium]|nr:hypothetical protein [Chloroflexota bacterium]